jgi:hypothetical protein
MAWDRGEYQRERQNYIAATQRREPMLFVSTLIFTATWLAGWGASTLLLWSGMASLPLRYGLGFLLAYGVFFACVRLWCSRVAERRESGGSNLGLDGGVDGEGCLIVAAAIALGLLVAGLFWMSGGVAALLEAAFEVAFAGTVVRRLGHSEIVGNWARALFVNTWPQALAMLLVLVGIAATLQRAAPGTTTFADAVSAIWAQRGSAR